MLHTPYTSLSCSISILAYIEPKAFYTCCGCSVFATFDQRSVCKSIGMGGERGSPESTWWSVKVGRVLGDTFSMRGKACCYNKGGASLQIYSTTHADQVSACWEFMRGPSPTRARQARTGIL